MGLSTISSQYTGLNGLYGYGTTFTGSSSLYSDSYVEDVKSGIANSYEISATSSSYSNKSSVSSSSFSQQCQAIEYLLEQGRTDDAIEKYNDLYEDMASNSSYTGYTENEIKTLLQEKYLTATGSTIVNDINTNSDSAFSTGLKSSIPVLGLLFNSNSSDDFVAEATGTETSGWSKVKTALGVVTSTAASAAAGAGIVTAASEALKAAGKSNTTAGKTAKIAAAAIAAGAALVTYIGNKITSD